MDQPDLNNRISAFGTDCTNRVHWCTFICECGAIDAVFSVSSMVELLRNYFLII